MKTRCMGCMYLKENSPDCEYCGYREGTDNNDHQLPVGTLVGGQYTLGKVLGQGGFGITYIGWDNTMNQRVAVKEFFPKGYASRTRGKTKVTNYDGQNSRDFSYNKQRFLREAESLAKLWDIPQIIRILRHFEENGTAYIVMEYAEGMDLRAYLKKLGRPLTVEETFTFLGPIMEALKAVHNASLVHRDIAPDNIMVLPDGSTKLLDFGAARYVENADAEQERQTSTQAVLKDGFAPPEQYQTHGALGPWTDEYAMCATIYYCLTGKLPPEAMVRIMEGKVIHWDQIPGLTAKQRAALEKGMSLQPKDRYPSVGELWEQLKSAPVEVPYPPAPQPKPEPEPPKPAPQPKPAPAPKPEPPKSAPEPVYQDPPEPRKKPVAAIAAAVLAAAIGVFLFTRGNTGDVKMEAELPAAMTEAAETTEATEPVVIPNVSCTFAENETGWTITGYEGTLPDEAILPREYDGKPVTAIGSESFKGCSALVSITIPDSVTSIGDYAFNSCEKLASVTVPDNVTSIGCFAFYATPWYDALTDKFAIFGDSVLLKYNGSAETVSIPSSVKYISSAFYENQKVRNINIPDSVTSIGSYAFYGCSSLSNIIIPVNVTSIGGYAFNSCGKLSSVAVPVNVTSIGRFAFYATPWYDDQKAEFVILGDGVLVKYNGSAKTVAIPSSVKYISSAFYENQKVTHISIPDGVTFIGASAFYKCANLASISIPESVTSIGDHAFYNCVNLSSISIPDSVTSIGIAAFYKCTSLSSISIPNGVSSIGGSAFNGCTKLYSITLPDGVTSIDVAAFQNCTSLTSITIPEGVTSIGNYAFSCCSSLSSITIPDSVTNIGGYAFEDCSSLSNITIPDSVTNIGGYAFEDCSSLSNITIPDSVTNIGSCAFMNTPWLNNQTEEYVIRGDGILLKYNGTATNITIPSNVKQIPSAFYSNEKVTHITIPDSVTSISYHAFYGCTNLSSISITDSVTSIANFAFTNCTSLASIFIPDGVTSIGGFAFYGCSSLSNITIPESVTSIGDHAFEDCTSLKRGTISRNCEIGDDSFPEDCTINYY